MYGCTRSEPSSGEVGVVRGGCVPSVPRKDQRAKGDCYLRGLMLDGPRKSAQAMALRLPDGNEQNLQQFVNQSTWDPVPVQRTIAERMLPLIDPTAWVIDDVSVPKDGRVSVAVAPQYCGALGKRANCQVAVSVHAATDTASCPLQWHLGCRPGLADRSWNSNSVHDLHECGCVGGPLPQPALGVLPRAELGRHVHPRRTGPVLPGDRVDHLPVIPPPPASSRCPVRQQRLDRRADPGRSTRACSRSSREVRSRRPESRAARHRCRAGRHDRLHV